MTGNRARAVPVPLAGIAGGGVRELAALSAAPGLTALSGAQLLMERAALSGLAFASGRAAGGACRLLPAGSATIAVSLPRASDWELIPAWLERSDDCDWTWQGLAAAIRGRASAELIDRARLLGMAAAIAGDPAPVPPAEYQVMGPAIGVQRRRGRRDGPLVVDLSGLWAGPLCSHLLQLAGARVIKVESLGRPDGARFGNESFYGLLNQGKRAVALDLATHAGQELLGRLIQRADIVLESSRPRALRQMGLNADALVKARAGLTWISITGYGRTPPRDNWIAFGDDAAVAAGLSGIMRRATGRYEFAGDAIADPLTGIRAALAAWRSWLDGGSRLISLSLSDVAGWCLAEEQRCLGSEAVVRQFGAWWSAVQSGRWVSAVDRRRITRPVATLGRDTREVLRELEPC